MDLVREAIDYIRLNWDDYPNFMRDLREFMEARLPSLDPRADALFSSVKRWADPGNGSESDDYSAVRLYTSAAGYKQMFQTINLAFRDDRLTTRGETLRIAVFLVELLTIDLFNYRTADARADNFEGRVFRGMLATADDLRNLMLVANAPIGERYVAIPLAMASASTDRDSALRFVFEHSRRMGADHAVLWEIDIVGLSPRLARIYMHAFPTSVVTSICAVPIETLSDYPDEREVLLRGPFFQLVRVREDERPRVPGTCVHVVEALMLNANRDHISSVELGEPEGARARELFRTLVAIDRATLCAERAEKYGLLRDAEAYRDLLSSQSSLLDRRLAGSGA